MHVGREDLYQLTGVLVKVLCFLQLGPLGWILNFHVELIEKHTNLTFVVPYMRKGSDARTLSLEMLMDCTEVLCLEH